MCLQAVVAVAQSVVSFAAASADYDAQMAQYKQNQINSLAAARDEQSQLNLRMVQQQAAFSQKQRAAEIERAEVSAEAENSAAAAGVSGISLGNILAGISTKVNQRVEADRTNHINAVEQIKQELKATNTTAQNRINSVARPTAPNPLGYALQGIGGALKSMPSSTA